MQTSSRAVSSTGPFGALRAALHERRIVVVSRDRDETRPIADLLRTSPYDVRFVTFQRSMLAEVDAISPDVIIVEYGVNDFDLLRVCRDLSANLSARIFVIAEADAAMPPDLQISALDAGADDFVLSSTSARVVMARLRASLRGVTPIDVRPRHIAVGDVIIDLDARTVHIDGRSVDFPHLQFQLLVSLASQPDRVIRRTTLLSEVWGSDSDDDGADSRRVRVAVSTLRRLLGTGASRPRIQSVQNIGYRLVVDGDVLRIAQ